MDTGRSYRLMILKNCRSAIPNHKNAAPVGPRNFNDYRVRRLYEQEVRRSNKMLNVSGSLHVVRYWYKDIDCNIVFPVDLHK